MTIYKCKRCKYELNYIPFYEFKPSETELYIECCKQCKICKNTTNKALPPQIINIKGHNMIIADLLDNSDINKYNIDVDKARECLLIGETKSTICPQMKTVYKITNSNVSINSNNLKSDNDITNDEQVIDQTITENSFDENECIEEIYTSITSIMKVLTELENNIEFVEFYFIPNNSFVNRYNNDVINPVAMLLKYKNIAKVKTFLYNDMISHLTFLPKISFKANEHKICKYMPMQKLKILNCPRKCKDSMYYVYNLFDITDNGIINKIKSGMIMEDNITADDWN